MSSSRSPDNRRNTRSRSVTPIKQLNTATTDLNPSPSLTKNEEEEEEEEDSGDEDEDIQQTLLKKRRNIINEESPTEKQTGKKKQKIEDTDDYAHDRDDDYKNAYAETNLVKTEFLEHYKYLKKVSIERERESEGLKAMLAESELKRVSAEAKLMLQKRVDDDDDDDDSTPNDGRRRRRRTKSVTPSPERGGRSKSKDRELAVIMHANNNNKNNNDNDDNENHHAIVLKYKKEIEARERAEGELEKLREQSVKLKTRVAALEKKVMDDEGDDMEDVVREENEVIEKMRKRLNSCETVNAELEMEVQDLRFSLNERKSIEAKLEEALEINKELKKAFNAEKQRVLEINNNNNNNSNNQSMMAMMNNNDDDEKDQLIKILREELKILEASASQGEVLKNKMVSIEALEERLRSTEAKLTRAKEKLRSKEIENDQLLSLKDSSGDLNNNNDNNDNNNNNNNKLIRNDIEISSLQTNTIELSEKLAETEKSLKVERTKKDSFEQKWKQEEIEKERIEKLFEEEKIEAMRLKSAIDLKEAEIENLKKMSANDDKFQKILQTKQSPFTNEIIRGLEKEIISLKAASYNNNNNNNNNTNNNTEIEKLQKKEQRLLQVFQATTNKFKDAVKLLFGYTLDLVVATTDTNNKGGGKVQFVVTNEFSSSGNNLPIVFDYDEIKRFVKLEKNDPNWAKQTEHVKKNYDFYENTYEEESGFVAAFLSNFLLEEFSKK